jgi:hypothetical protein
VLQTGVEESDDKAMTILNARPNEAIAVFIDVVWLRRKPVAQFVWPDVIRGLLAPF